MQVAVSGKNMAIGGIIGAVGAVAAIIGAFMPWDSATVQGLTISESAWDGNAGKTIVVASLIGLALAVAWLLGRKLPVSLRAAEIVIIVAGAIVLLVVAANWSDVNDAVNAVNKMVPGAASLGIGIWLTILGGVAMVVGGVLGLVKKS